MSEYPRASIETIRERVRTSDEFSAADREVILEFSDRIDLLGQAKYSDERHEFILMRAAKLAQDVGGLAAALEDEANAKPLVRWINRTYDNPESNKDYRTALRTFGKIVTEGDDVPESLEWVPGGYPSNYDPAPDPGDMLRWEDDVRPMLNECHNLRDRAIIALAWDLGPRPGELYNLSIGSFADHEHGLQVTVQGKRGQRSPLLIPSVTFVQQWLNAHPGDDPEDPLWTRIKQPEAITPQRIRDMLKERAKEAGVTKPVTPRNFRKSSATYLASQGVSQAHLEDHHGWVRGSSIAARYIAVFDEANDREIARAHGLDVSEESGTDDGPGRLTCPRCERTTPADEDTCVWCGQAVSPDAVEATKDRRQRVTETLAKIDDPATREALSEMFNLQEESPPIDGS